ncbi:TIGR03619 family F420-dependent LLM class oxidoreductase [Pseudonocardia acidicola]|uniref:TIGR03619 family F420-dependent LLM class oxidoreductase n=1 Tax=Pseudonocardia acidicola TaxID=2724939 RepID=A0ABX1SCK3_9PSEU|nr:TIGR03619 family F420-dependent LLM class oxidoreductase [Pseudonocardia acidicola]NMH98262.1 TIGR03619 family F420-dependent LLM class oxidoreductase [Pseudonocardia acidicola]
MTTVGLALPQLGPVVSGPLLRDFAQEAERMGFAHLWVQDHFLYAVEQEGDYAGSASSQPAVYQSVFGPTEVLAAVATWTSTVELGTSILVGGNHWPAQLAQQLSTVDQLSGGRLTTVGLGVGWSHEEHRAVGVDPTTRGRRMDDFVPVLLACWGEDPVEHHGPFFDVPRSIIRPKPVTPPRLMSGMWSAKGLARTAAQYDLWNPGSMPVAQAVDLLGSINAQRPAGRDPVGVFYRVGLESTAGKRMTVDEVAQRVSECAAADFEGVIVETNFCREIEAPEDWLKILASLGPVLEAGGVPE